MTDTPARDAVQKIAEADTHGQARTIFGHPVIVTDLSIAITAIGDGYTVVCTAVIGPSGEATTNDVLCAFTASSKRCDLKHAMDVLVPRAIDQTREWMEDNA